MSTTVLDIVQLILSDIDSDEVNSIGDTIEASQIANLVEQYFYIIVDEFDLQAVKKLFQLEGLGDVSRPTVMRIPEGVHSIEWIRYNIRRSSDTADNWAIVHQLDPADFIEHTLKQREQSVASVVGSGVSVYIGTDAPPQYWTTFDGNELVFDSYDTGVDSTVQSSKTNCYGQGRPTLVKDDSTPIPLPPRQIILLQNEARKAAFDLFKDGIPLSVMQAANQSRVRSQRTRDVDRMNRERPNLPDYGRRPRR